MPRALHFADNHPLRVVEGWAIEQERPVRIYPMEGRLGKRNRIILPWQTCANS